MNYVYSDIIQYSYCYKSIIASNKLIILMINNMILILEEQMVSTLYLIYFRLFIYRFLFMYDLMILLSFI